MSMGSGAAEGLQQVLQRLFLEAKFKQDQQEHSDRMSLGQQEMGLRGQDIANDTARIGEGRRQFDTVRTDNMNAAAAEQSAKAAELQGHEDFEATMPEHLRGAYHASGHKGNFKPEEFVNAPLTYVQQDERALENEKAKSGVIEGRELKMIDARGKQEAQQIAARGAQERQTATAGQSGKAAKSGDFADAYGQERGQRMRDAVDELLPITNNTTTGWGSMLKGVPTSDALHYKAKLDSLKANVGFNEITEMRQASKTGGALGQVSDKEIGFLQSSLAALDQAQTPEQVKSELLKVKATLDRWEAAKAQYSGGTVQTPNAQAGAQGDGGMVPMVDPNGRALNVPASEVQRMMSLGAKRR